MPKKENFISKQIARMQRWMDSVPGQTFLNYAYNWGAAIVILGTLFKLTHWAGANIMLCIGMGTEVFVFFISAFDRPFDKTGEASISEDFVEDDENAGANGGASVPAGAGFGGGIVGGGNTIIGGGSVASDDIQTEGAAPAAVGGGTVVVGGGSQGGGTVIVGGGGGVVGGGSFVAGGNAPASSTPVVDQIISDAISTAVPEGSEEADRLAKIIRMANDELLHRAQAVLSPDMEAASQEYIEKLRTLTETLHKVDEQSARLTRDSQEMENLNRTLIGINKVYDLHFASISKQVTTIEQINEQTRELASKIDEVNQIYARMMQQLNIMANPAAAMTAPAAMTASAAMTTPANS